MVSILQSIKTKHRTCTRNNCTAFVLVFSRREFSHNLGRKRIAITPPRDIPAWARTSIEILDNCRRYLTRSDTLSEFHSQVLPSSAEKAWLQIGRCGLRTSHRKTMMML